MANEPVKASVGVLQIRRPDSLVSRSLGALLSAVTLLLAPAAQGELPRFNKMRIDVEIEHRNGGFPYSGFCPIRVHFNGKVSAGHTKTIIYRWERSDAPSDTQDRKAEIIGSVFGSAFETPMEDVRNIGAPGQIYEGTQTLMVLGLIGEPYDNQVNLRSRPEKMQVRYQITCWAPDLAIVSVTNVPFAESGQCVSVVYKLQYTIKNDGAMNAPETEIWVVSDDYRVPNRLTKDGGWGSNVRVPALGIGATATVVVPILYLDREPTFMGAHAHTFNAVINPVGSFPEMRRDNNSSSIRVDPPPGCPAPAPKSVALPKRQEVGVSAAPPPTLARMTGAASSKDAPNCNDHPLSDFRVADYAIESCIKKPVGAYSFDVGKSRNPVEGRYWYVRYRPAADTSTKPNAGELLRGLDAEIRKRGGTVVAADSNKETVTFTRDGSEFWVELWTDHTGRYILTIVEKAKRG